MKGYESDTNDANDIANSMGSLNLQGNESGELGGENEEESDDVGDDNTAWGNLDDSVSSSGPSAPSSPSPFGRALGKFGKGWGQSKPKPTSAPPKRAATPPTSSLISFSLFHFL